MELPTDTTLALRGSMLVVRKHRLGRTPAEMAQARTETAGEAQWLIAAQHPGVVGLARASPDDGILESVHCGMASLRTARLDRQTILDVLEAVITTLIEVHRRGLRHGQLSADHVIISRAATGGPRLCSPAPTPTAPALDLASNDVVGIGQLLAELATSGPIHEPAWLGYATELANPDSGIGLVQAKWLIEARLRPSTHAPRLRPALEHGMRSVIRPAVLIGSGRDRQADRPPTRSRLRGCKRQRADHLGGSLAPDH